MESGSFSGAMTFAGLHMAKLVEHWDTTEAIPPPTCNAIELTTGKF